MTTEWLVPIGRTLGRRHKAHAFVRHGTVLVRSQCGGWLVTESSVRAEVDEDKRCRYCVGLVERAGAGS